ncbi:hypothetical protein BX600DRAFT_461280 [Xylariales sp. PMI_506]|nr:hypothetical protein BX600DRAFT_461280 [Xylariales sp. PMI_506]
MEIRLKIERSLLPHHSKKIDIAKAIGLSCIITVCYILIIVLYVQPAAVKIDSFTSPDVSGIKPTTAIAFVSIILTSATTTLVANAVEQYLWRKLMLAKESNVLAATEASRLAGWLNSHLTRTVYILTGSLWTIKIAGLALIGAIFVSSALVDGISTIADPSFKIFIQQQQVDRWAGWVDAASSAYNGGEVSDVLGTVAALTSLNGLSAPASSVCSNSSCSATAVAPAMQASCLSYWAERGSLSVDGNSTYTSTYNEDINVEIVGGTPFTFANFTTGPPANMSVGTAPQGQWAVILGAFANYTSSTGKHYVNIVDCIVTLGSINITQTGTETPELVKGSYQQNTSVQAVPNSLYYLHDVYVDGLSDQTPFGFTGVSGTGDGANSLYKSAVGTLLLNSTGATSAAQVAASIEAMYDMATLLSFARSPGSATSYITTTISHNSYVFDKRFLAILVVPLIATICGLWGRLKIEGNDVVIGYDPVRIAEHGQKFAGPSRANTIEQGRILDMEEKLGPTTSLITTKS